MSTTDGDENRDQNHSKLTFVASKLSSSAFIFIKSKEFSKYGYKEFYRLAIALEKVGKVDFGWGTHEFIRLGDRGLEREYRGSVPWVELKDKLLMSDRLLLYRGDALVDAFPLRGAPAAIDQVERCLRGE